MKIFKCTIILILVFLLYNCGTSRFTREITKELTLKTYQNQFTGLLIVDPESRDTLISYNSEKYFTPASNTKIFTLFSAFKFLGDSIPAFKYRIDLDTISIVGTGDPSFLHPYFRDSTAIKFIEKYSFVNIYDQNIVDEKYGPGWAWEDYDSYFSPERTSLPLYGNVLQLIDFNGIRTIPNSLGENVSKTNAGSKRDYNDNIFYAHPKDGDTILVPLVMNLGTRKILWDSILTQDVKFKHILPKADLKIKYSIPSDSLYKRMMNESDNFLAEQILLLCSSTISDTLDSEEIRKSILSKQLSGLKQKPRWVDGSGLSRYNLFTPLSIVQVLSRMYYEIPRNRLFNIFPSGEKSGTLKNWYMDDKPYVYAKSGTVGNNHCLSGYLITKSNKTLVFSFMNNHYTRPTSQVKDGMKNILEFLRENY